MCWAGVSFLLVNTLVWRYLMSDPVERGPQLHSPHLLLYSSGRGLLLARQNPSKSSARSLCKITTLACWYPVSKHTVILSVRSCSCLHACRLRSGLGSGLIRSEWMMHLYSALLCISVHTKRFTIMCGGGLSSTTTSVLHPLEWCDRYHRTTAPVRSPHTSYRWRA